MIFYVTVQYFAEQLHSINKIIINNNIPCNRITEQDGIKNEKSKLSQWAAEGQLQQLAIETGDEMYGCYHEIIPMRT